MTLWVVQAGWAEAGNWQLSQPPPQAEGRQHLWGGAELGGSV